MEGGLGPFDIDDIIGRKEAKEESGAPDADGQRAPGKQRGPRTPGRGPARPARPSQQPRTGGRGWGARLWWIVAAVFILVFVLPSLLAEMITDWMWFGSQNLAEVYTTRLWLGLGVFAVAGLVAALFLWANWAIALAPPAPKWYTKGKAPRLRAGWSAP